jgi:hypothetical protein
MYALHKSLWATSVYLFDVLRSGLPDSFGYNLPNGEKYTKWPQSYQMAVNDQHFSFQGPPKCTQTGMFGMKIYLLATLIQIAGMSRVFFVHVFVTFYRDYVTWTWRTCPRLKLKRRIFRVGRKTAFQKILISNMREGHYHRNLCCYVPWKSLLLCTLGRQILGKSGKFFQLISTLFCNVKGGFVDHCKIAFK